MKFKLCEKCHEVRPDGQVCGNCGFVGEGKIEDATRRLDGKITDCFRPSDGFAVGGFLSEDHGVPIDQAVFVGAPQVVRQAAKTAAEIVQSAADAISQRGTLRDNAAGERSMKRAVDAFNGLLGRPALTEQEGWLFMCVLKMARATAGKHHLDDYTDLAGYAGLAGECGELAAAANDSGDEVMQFNKDYKHAG